MNFFIFFSILPWNLSSCDGRRTIYEHEAQSGFSGIRMIYDNVMTYFLLLDNRKVLFFTEEQHPHQ